MIIYLIVGQRKESYRGEYGPEVLGAEDEFSNDENGGEWLLKEVERYRNPDRAESVFEAVEVITISVPMQKIMDRLRPGEHAITATVVEK
jgi:hypothetical protein